MHIAKRYTLLLQGTQHCTLRKFVRVIGLTALALLAFVGTATALDELIDPLVMAKVKLHRFSNAERALKAEAQVKEFEAVMSGQIKMFEREDGSKYGKAAECKWTTVEFIEEKK